MLFKIAICDDDPVDQALVTGLLREWSETSGRPVSLQTFASAEQFLFHYAEEKDYQILVLDIEMGKMNGVELAKKLRQENAGLQLLFVTGFPDFIAEGYEVDAVHYLMKPLEKEKFFRAMNKAAERSSEAEPVLLLEEGGEVSRIALKEIFYVEVFSHSCVLHTKEGTVEYRTAIGRLSEELGEGFVRVHRSYLVNLERIRRITKTDVILENGEAVPLARRKYNEVNLAFITYYKGRLGINENN